MTASVASVIQNALNIAVTASAKALPPPPPAAQAPGAGVNQLYQSLATTDQQNAWAKVINTMVRSEAALKAASGMARQASDAFNESAIIVKQQIDTLTMLSDRLMM